jgi:hypothetical protein
MPEEKRTRWFCILDEFQRFIAYAGSALAVAEMLSEARKFGFSPTETYPDRTILPY